MREYDQETLQKLQKYELHILKDFVEICEKNNLTYLGLAGTGIGALRHGGFIPWDDDIDVALPREDYEKFLQIIRETKSDKYFIGNAETMENYPLMTTRLMLKGTTFREEALKDVDCFFGIFLDIYALDNASDDPKKFKRQAWTSWFWSKLMILRQVPNPVLALDGFTRKLVLTICAIVHYSMVLFRISPKWLYKQCKKASMKYQNEKTKHMGFFCDTKPFINMINCEKSFPLRRIPFEGYEFPFPNNIEEMLTEVYGDYMQLPPVEKRKNHFPHILDFGKEGLLDD